MDRSIASCCVLSLALLFAAAAAPTSTLAEEPKTKEAPKKDLPKTKETKEAKDSGVEWKAIMEINAQAPAVAGATYAADKEFTTTEKALRFKAKISSATGKGGNVTLTLFKLGKPVKKIPVMKAKRDGESEVIIPIEPGNYKIEITVNNLNATVTIEEGKKK